MHKKYALSTACTILLFLTFVLAHLRLRHGKLIGFGLSMITAVIYWYLLFFAQLQIFTYPISAALFIWAPNIILGTLGILLLHHEALMKLYRRYIFKSTINVGLGALFLTTLMLISVDLFANLDTYLSHELPLATIAYLTLLGAPQAVLFALGPPCCSVRPSFSQLHANNEYICLIGSGIRPLKIILPIIAVGLIASILQFAFAEYVKLPLSKERLVLEEELFGLRSTQDNRNITLHDPEGRYVLYARHYRAQDNLLREVLLLLFDEQGNLTHRLDAQQGRYDEDSGQWRFHGVQSQEVGEVVSTRTLEAYDNPRINLDPSYFRGAGGDIDQMDIQTALQYLHWMKRLDPNRHTIAGCGFR